MNHVAISETKLSIEKLTCMVTSPGCGAVASFMGTTRDNFDNKTVVKLEYEAYDEMAKKKMLEVCQEIRSQWKVENIAIEHRIGVVPVAESSIIIAVSSAHRSESLEAVSYAINRLKEVVPIWKKEVYEDETSAWKQNKECSWSEARLENGTNEGTSPLD
ncbi:molybdopterin synthase catalytic subunit-like [Gigantopelta aegis]|uniref:molybdopterin synthase catalytic subunit-like n=1 Tax=Gigantopelta aegis TaxID=1735272 RepID=UPI001B88754F|nr:molybdopterin synthase catalytic subunit-like [Gigantopelta aegis]XP_041373859.1 molybdopterin synthase catalytic subunit-like [Gigantopelta aegis]